MHQILINILWLMIDQENCFKCAEGAEKYEMSIAADSYILNQLGTKINLAHRVGVIKKDGQTAADPHTDPTGHNVNRLISYNVQELTGKVNCLSGGFRSNRIHFIRRTEVLHSSRVRAWCKYRQDYVFNLCWVRVHPQRARTRRPAASNEQIHQISCFISFKVTSCCVLFCFVCRFPNWICESTHFLKAQVSVCPPMFSGLGLAYFGVHVLGELEDGVHSRPGVRVLF